MEVAPLNLIATTSRGRESYIWTRAGDLRLASALTVILAGATLATVLVAILLARVDAATLEALSTPPGLFLQTDSPNAATAGIP